MSTVETDPSTRHLVLVGSMGVGKTEVGRELAARLGRPLLDSDAYLLAVQRRSGREVAERDGVGALHQSEAEHLLHVLSSSELGVVAAAASVVDGDRCLEALRSADVVWLRARPDTAVRRMEGGTHRRSLGPAAVEALTALTGRRAPRYDEVADLVIDTDDLAVHEIVTEILSWLTARYA